MGILSFTGVLWVRIPPQNGENVGFGVKENIVIWDFC